MQVSKILLSKKSDMSARKIIFYGIFAFLAAIVFLIIVGLITSNKSEISEIPVGLEDYLVAQRFLDSHLCFVFEDKGSGRIYPWIIDLAKFNQENLNKCYGAENTKVKAYRLKLNFEKEERAISTRNWEGFLNKAETEEVIVYDDGKLQRAELLIEMQNAK